MKCLIYGHVQKMWEWSAETGPHSLQQECWGPRNLHFGWGGNRNKKSLQNKELVFEATHPLGLLYRLPFPSAHLYSWLNVIGLGYFDV